MSDHPTSADYAMHAAGDNKRELEQIKQELAKQRQIILMTATAVLWLLEEDRPTGDDFIRQFRKALEEQT